MSIESDHSPLELVEQAVLARAKHGAIDVSSNDGARLMRTYIDDAIEQWNFDHQRGLRPFGLSDPDLIAERALRNLTGYGPSARCSRTTTCGRSWSTPPTRYS